MNGRRRFCFILPADSSKPVCLICSETNALIKSGNVKHRPFELSYPLKSQLRARKITELRAQYDRSTRFITHIYSPATCKRMFTKGSVDFRAIKNISWWDSCEGVLNCGCRDVIWRKTKRRDVWKKSNIPMSASTATIKSEILADDVNTQLDAAIQSAPCISLAIDESTDVIKGSTGSTASALASGSC